MFSTRYKYDWEAPQNFHKPIMLVETGRVKRAVLFPFNALKAPGTKGASFVSQGKWGAWEFADGKDETVVFSFRPPFDMDFSTKPELSLRWSSGASNKQAVWQLDYLFLIEGEVVTQDGQTISGASSSGSVADELVIKDFELENPPEEALCLNCRLKRLGTDDNDTLGTTAELHSILYRYTSNSLGEPLD